MEKADHIMIVTKPDNLVVGRYMTVEQWTPETGCRSFTYDHATDTWDPEKPPRIF
jgi:hypothetical protein